MRAYVMRLLTAALLAATLLGCAAAPSSPGPTNSVPAPAAAASVTPPGVPPSVMPAVTDTPGPTASVAPTLRPLTRRPLVWFGPLAYVLIGGQPVPGADDFMQLFTPDAPWSLAAQHVDIFNLNGGWVEDVPWTQHASDAELAQVVADLNRRGIAIGVEVGPFDPTTCGKDVESFGGGIEAARRIIDRIQAAGGVVRFVSLDEPYTFAGQMYNGPNACHWSDEQVARTLGSFVEQLQQLYPGVVVADIEAMREPSHVDALEGWIDAYRQVNGANLPYFHLDVDYQMAGWAPAAKELEDFCHERGIEFGIYYIGSGLDTTDEAWLTNAGQRVKEYEMIAGGKPDHVLFQSWHDKPDHVLPETGPFTFTHLINLYFDDRASLGIRTEGAGANLAFGKKTQASNSLPSSGADLTIDGNSATLWNSGGPPPQWIEVDLGAPYTVAGIRLTAAMSPSVGETTHRVLGKGPGTSEEYVLLHTFSGPTADQDVLSFTPETPWPGIQYVRVETVESPSWIAWYEIEVIAGS